MGGHRQHAREEGVPRQGRGAGGRRLRSDRHDRRHPAAAPRGRSPVPCRRQPLRPCADARRRWQPADLLPARADHLDRRGHPERPEPAGAPPGARARPRARSRSTPSRRRRPMRREGSSLQPWPDTCAGSPPRSTSCKQTLPERQRALRDVLVQGAAASTHARHCGQPDPGLGDVPAVRRGGWSNQPRRCRAHAHPGARRPDRLGRGAARAPGERGACHALPGSARGGDQQRPRSCRRRGDRGATRGCRLLGLAAQQSSARATTSGRSGARTASGSAGSARTTSCWIRRPPSPRRRSWRATRARASRSSSGRSGSGWPSRDCSASRDPARGTNTVRLTIEGMRRDVLHLRTSALAAGTDQPGDETDQRDETDQEKGPESRGFPGRGQFGQFGQKTEHRGRDERDLRDAVGWEVEI